MFLGFSLFLNFHYIHFIVINFYVLFDKLKKLNIYKKSVDIFDIILKIKYRI